MLRSIEAGLSVHHIQGDSLMPDAHPHTWTSLPGTERLQGLKACWQGAWWR